MLDLLDNIIPVKSSQCEKFWHKICSTRLIIDVPRRPSAYSPTVFTTQLAWHASRDTQLAWHVSREH